MDGLRFGSGANGLGSSRGREDPGRGAVEVLRSDSDGEVGGDHRQAGSGVLQFAGDSFFSLCSFLTENQ